MLSIKLSENKGKAPEAVPYMPAGVQEICCTVNGRAGKRVVMVDEAACERLNADLQEHLRASAAGEKARPVILFDHKAGNAAAVPTGFEWDEQRGILLKVDWTAAGREAVEGGNYGYISPAFRLERGSDRISGLQDGVEVGSLVNDPAFQRNECIAAAHAEPEDVQVWAANPYGCNQHGHEWVAKHGENWGGGAGGDDTLDSIKKRKFSLNQKLQKTRDEMVKLGKLSSAEEDIEKRKEINKKLEELGKTKKKQTEEYQKLAMKETELKDRERQEKAKQEKERFSKAKSDTDIDKEVDDFLKGTNDERWVKVTQWRAEVRKAKDEALDIRESTAYRKGEPEAIKKYNEAKEKANKAAQRSRNIVKKASEKRGYSGKKLDALLRHYPETVLSAREEEEQELEDELVCASNPYGCNQYGHEWAGKHGEGWGGKAVKDEGKERLSHVKQKADGALKEYDEASALWTDDRLGKKARKVNKLQLIRKIWSKMNAHKDRVNRMLNKESLTEEEQKDLDTELDGLSYEAKRAKKWVRIINSKTSDEELQAAFAELECEIEDEYIAASNLPPFCTVEKVEQKADNIDAADSGCETPNEEDMETIKKMLGLDDGATTAEVAAAIAALKKKQGDGQKRLEEVEAECNEHKKALAEHKEKAADGFIDRLKKGGKMSPQDEETLKAARDMYIENPERTERIYAAMKPICPVAVEADEVQAGRVPEGQTFATMSLADCYGSMEF